MPRLPTRFAAGVVEGNKHAKRTRLAGGGCTRLHYPHVCPGNHRLVAQDHLRIAPLRRGLSFWTTCYSCSPKFLESGQRQMQPWATLKCVWDGDTSNDHDYSCLLPDVPQVLSVQSHCTQRKRH